MEVVIFLQTVLGPLLNHLDPLVSIIVVLALAISIISGLSYFKSSNASNTSIEPSINVGPYNGLYKLLHEYHEKNEENTRKILNLSIKLEKLTSTIEQLEDLQLTIPIPIWVKCSNLKLLNANGAFSKAVLEPIDLKLSEYIGTKDSEFWPYTFKSVAKEVEKVDQQVLDKETFWVGHHPLPGNTSDSKDWLVIKFPAFDKSNTKVVGVTSIALPSYLRLDSI